MNLDELDYDLPSERIAQEPVAVRDRSRLLVLNRANGKIEHRQFADLPEFLNPGDMLVLNDTRVLAAKFALQRETGGKVEGLFLSTDERGRWDVLLKPSRRLRPGECLTSVVEPVTLHVEESLGNGCWKVRVDSSQVAAEVLERIGTPPLPPYVKRPGEPDSGDLKQDRERYQTVYATNDGSVAAPTAGLHFTPELLTGLESKGVRTVRITLHVGIGTFRPVATSRLDEHEMHAEWYDLPEGAASRINEIRKTGGRVVAVGTTSARVLETCATPSGQLAPGHGWTRLFIYPPYVFRSVDALITNFHLPRSTLLALVFAFAGRERTRHAYREAIAAEYRFYSFGDAMLIL